jgi:nitroreductase/molybdopterin/thiamine biosynthesis adenylyltransferase
MKIESELQARALQEGTAGDWQPHHFDLSGPEDRAALAELLGDGTRVVVHDAIRAQLDEWIEAREPARDFSVAEREAASDACLAGLPLWQFGRWVYYPWSRRLVHVLPEPAFVALRSDRNRYKITPEEQVRLRSCTIGIVGLSAGQAAAVTLGLEGVGGRFRLADFDTLGLSNLNRLRAGVHNLGVNKAVLAAREMFEIDPYLRIALFPAGVSDDNLDGFLLGNGQLDLLVEECDDLAMKVRLRERAREVGIPVLMTTSERGLLDVERFDREPNRPLFHGLAGEVRADALRALPARDKLPFVLRLLGGALLSVSGAASLVEIKETLSTWPQLASAVALGWAVLADVARRILLGTFTGSGRFCVDLETIRDFNAVVLPEQPAEEEATSAVALAPPQRIPLPPRPPGEALSAEEVRYLVGHAILAPSGGNCQPWRFIWRPGRLLCRHDVGRSASLLDFEHGASYLALGAAAENMDLAAASLGLRARVEEFPEPADRRLVCALTFTRKQRPARPPELLEEVYLRATNRQRSQRQPLAPADREALLRAAQAFGARLQLVTEVDVLDKVQDILGAGDRLRLLSQVLHSEMMRELRWTPQEVETTCDGVDVATLELSPAERAALQLLSSWPTLACVRRIGRGGALEKAARQAVAAASAVGLLIVPGVGPGSYFRGGRVTQRVWLRATACALAFQPLTALPYLFARLERGGGAGLEEEEKHTLRGLRERYRDVFDVPSGWAEVMLFRVGYAGSPVVRSLRRRLEDVLAFPEANPDGAYQATV